MNLKRQSDGKYLASYDGSKNDLIKLLEHLKTITFAGVGNSNGGFTLLFHGLTLEFHSARELFYYALGGLDMMESPPFLKMEDHVKTIVRDVFKLDETPFLSSTEFSDPEEG